MDKEENILSSKELLLVMEKILISSGFIIYSVLKGNNNFIEFNIEKNNKKYRIFANIRNIGSAYLPKKPYIMRRQVSKMLIDEIPLNRGNNLSMLLAIKKVENQYILACWNPFYFVGHSKNRSCYVLQQSLENAYLNGLYQGIDCKTPVLVCSEKNMEQLIEVYIERNSVD